MLTCLIATWLRDAADPELASQTFCILKASLQSPNAFPLSGVSMFTKSLRFSSAISRANKYAVIPKGGGEPSDEIPLMTNMFHQHFLIPQPSSRQEPAASTSLRRRHRRTECPRTLRHAEPTHVTPFDQSHSRLIRPTFTLNRSNYSTELDFFFFFFTFARKVS